MSPALANDILSFIFESDKPAYKATLAAVAEAKHVRPVFLERQPRAERHATMLAALTKPQLDAAAAALHPRLAGEKAQGDAGGFPERARHPATKTAWWKICRRAMDDAKLKAAVEILLGKYPHEVVAVYLNAFNDMNAANWPNLKTMLETDTRLQLGNHA